MQRRHRISNNGRDYCFCLVWMAGKRKAYTPFSTSSEAGITAAPVEGYIHVDQEVQPIIDTGFVDNKGQWIGHKTSDKNFIQYTDVEIANGGYILTPSVNADGSWPLDMTGYNALFIAIKPTNGGNYRTEAVMGPDSLPFANLSPVNAAAQLRGNLSFENGSYAMSELIIDAADTMTVDVWNIFYIANRLKGQKLLQFKITNNSGDISTIETAFMRLV